MNAGLLVAELPTLFDGLERAGFTVTIQSRLAVHDLLLRLTVEGSPPGNADSLGRMIGPILCTSPSEQEQFESLFQQWRERLVEPEAPPIEDTPTTGITNGPTPPKRSNSGRPILFGCLIAAVIALAVWMNERRFEEDRPPFDFEPMSQLDTTADQTQTAVKPDDKSNDSVPDPKQPDDSKTPVEQPAETTAQDPAQPEESSENIAAGSLAKPKRTTKTHTTESKPRFGLAAAVTGIGLLLSLLTVCSWWWLSAHWRKRFLVKRSVGHDPELKQLAVQCTLNGRFGNSFWRTAQRFRQHLSRSSHRLDISRTAARTAANGGLFTPVRAEEKISPSYLMLIDSDGRRDQQTQTIDSMVDQLESEGVAVTRYYFRGDPRVCRQPGGRARKLAELAASHHSDRLMVFSDARSFMDPMTGRVSSWVEAFESWPERALLVAAEPDNWSSAEAAMSQQFRLASANAEGLSALVEDLTPDPALTPRVGIDRYPAMLREHSERWLDCEAPSQESLNKLLDQLRDYLGDAGYQWLSACAVYPTLHNRLTLWTGEGIRDKNNRPSVNDSDLMRLSRLPWLRQGHLPDWLRARLIADLSERQELAIRDRLEQLFRSALKPSNTDTALPVARETATSRQERRNPGRVLRDHTFISFMSNPLSVRLPRSVGRVLPFHHNWQPRRAFAVALASGVLFAAFAFLLPPAGQATTDIATLTKNLSDNRRGLAHFAESSEQNVPVPLSSEGFRIGSKPAIDSQTIDKSMPNIEEPVNSDVDVSKQAIGTSLSINVRITNTPVVVVGDDLGVSIDVVNESQEEIPSTAAIEARYLGPFEPKGFLDTFGEGIPPGESRKFELPGIAVQKNGEFAIEVKVHADSTRERLLAETNVRARAYKPLSAPISTVFDQPQKSAHIAVKGPTQANVGEWAKYKIIVSNTGTKPLANVTIRNKFDIGLKHITRSRFEYEHWYTENYGREERAKINAVLNRPADAPLVSDLAGHHPIKKNIGELGPGDSRFVAVQFHAARPGKHCQIIQILDGDDEVASTEYCLNAVGSRSRRKTIEPVTRPDQRPSQSLPMVQQQSLPPRPPSARPPTGNPPVLPSLPLPRRAQQTSDPSRRNDETIRIRLNEPKLPLVPPQDREPYVIEFSDDFNFDMRLTSALKSWRPFIVIKTGASGERALSGRIGQWVAAWNEGRSYAKPPNLRGTPREIRFGTEATKLLGNPLAPPTISARDDTKEAQVHALKPYNLASNAGSGQPIQIWLYNRFYTQALPENLRQANLPPIPLPGEQRVVPSTAGGLDVQQRPRR